MLIAVRDSDGNKTGMKWVKENDEPMVHYLARTSILAAILRLLTHIIISTLKTAYLIGGGVIACSFGLVWFALNYCWTISKEIAEAWRL